MKPPCHTCPGKCCYNAPASKREFKLLRKKYGMPIGGYKKLSEDLYLLSKSDDGKCPYYDQGCSVYPDRPEMCRWVGDKKEFPCPVVHPFAAMTKLNSTLARIHNEESAPGKA